MWLGVSTLKYAFETYKIIAHLAFWRTGCIVHFSREDFPNVFIYVYIYAWVLLSVINIKIYHTPVKLRCIETIFFAGKSNFLLSFTMLTYTKWRILDTEIVEMLKTKKDYILDGRWQVPGKIPMALVSIMEQYGF